MLYKLCSHCNKKIPYGKSKCSECETTYKKERWQDYDKRVRKNKDNKKYDSFYHSKSWLIVVDIVKDRLKYLDIYSYYILHKIEYGNACHHIEPIKTQEGWNDRLNPNHVIYLTDTNHDMMRSLYNTDYAGTKMMLNGLLDRFNKEFNPNLNKDMYGEL